MAQFICMDTIAEAVIDDVPTKVLLDTGATIDLMPIGYTEATGLGVKLLSLIMDRHVTMSLAVGQYSEAVWVYGIQPENTQGLQLQHG